MHHATPTQQPATPPITAMFPWPPPGWAAGNARAKEYRRDCWESLIRSPMPNITEPVTLTVRCCPRDGRRYDYFSVVVDTLIDVLTHHQVIAHQRQIQTITLERGSAGNPGYLRVQIFRHLHTEDQPND